MKASINKFREIHLDKTIAVLGSSPTINLYQGNEDVSIAVNGSVMCDSVRNIGRKIDYFMCGDRYSPDRQWFRESMEICDTRIIPTFIAPFDPIVLPDKSERSFLKRILEKDAGYERNGNISFSPEFNNIQEPHGIFEYADLWEQEIGPNQRKLCRGGTISGVAAQMAMIMGAKEIHLYGCSFGKPGSNLNHYGYDNKGEPGGITNFHPVRMDYILSMIVSPQTSLREIKVISHGFTTLRIPEKHNAEEPIPAY